MNCLRCDKETKNPKYCSKSCAALTNNARKDIKRRTVEGQCFTCKSPNQSSRKYCKECWIKNGISLGDMTLQQAIYTKHHKSSAFGLVRSRARIVAKSLNWNSCSNCSYDKHIEIAHIKPISSFPLDTMISVINDPSNLLALCPNCHWEFDHKK